jgi:hypothetical protein
MRISRVLWPELAAPVASRLIYSPVGDTTRHYDAMSKEITTQFTLRTAGSLLVSDLTSTVNRVYKMFT